MKRARSPSIVSSRILASIAATYSTDVAEMVIRLGLRSCDPDVQEGVWNLTKVSRFWSQHRSSLVRFLATDVFPVMDAEFASIQTAYKDWTLSPANAQLRPFPWKKTLLGCYKYVAPPKERFAERPRMRLFRPIMVAWINHRFPRSAAQTDDAAIRANLDSAMPSWASLAMMRKPHEADPPMAGNMSLSLSHPIFSLVRSIQISSRLTEGILAACLCTLPHEETVPSLLYVLASCHMANWTSDESNRRLWQNELCDTIFINKAWKRPRRMDDKFADVLMPSHLLY